MRAFPIVRLMLFIGLAHVALAHPSAAEEGKKLKGTIGSTTVSIVVPDDYCPLNPSFPADARMIKLLRTAQAGKNYVVVQFANCEQLKKWRSGNQKVLDDLGGVTTPIQYANQALPYSRAVLIAQLARIYRSRGGAILKGATGEVNRKIGAAAKNLKLNETKFLGVMYEDGNGVYVGLLQSLKTEFGEPKVQIGVTAVTVVQGKMLSISVYTPAVTENSSSEALATAKSIVEKTLAANGG